MATAIRNPQSATTPNVGPSALQRFIELCAPACKEITKLAVAYQSQVELLAQEKARANEARLRLPEVDLLLLDRLKPGERDALLLERTVLGSELSGHPTRLAELTRRVCKAHLTWLAAVRNAAKGEIARCEQELSEPERKANTLKKRVLQADTMKSGYDILAPEERRKVTGDLAALSEGMADARQRLQVAITAFKVTEGVADNLYGASLDRLHTWHDSAERAARQAARFIPVAM